MNKTLKKHNNKFRSAVIVIGIVGSVLIVSGCTQSTPLPVPSDTSSSANYGDVIVKEKITDAYGPYESTTIDPNNPIYKKIDSAALDLDVKKYWSEADILSAQQWTVKFLAEQATDSIAVDGTTGWADWQKTGSQYVTGPYAESLISSPSSATDTDRSGIIWNNPNNYTPVMVRDGKPRIVSNKIRIKAINNFEYQGQNYIQVAGTVSTKYRVTDEAAIAGVAKQLNTTESAVKAKFPLFQDGKNNVLDNVFTYSYTLAKKGDGWGIVGYNTDYKASYEENTTN